MTDKKQPQVQEGNDLEARQKGFNDELLPLLGKYKVGLGAVPFIFPDGRIGARPTLFDDKPKPVDEKKEEVPVETEKLSEA